MDVNLDTLLSQKRELERYADELQEVKSLLAGHRERLGAFWDADEMERMEEVIERLRRDARRMAEDLNGIGHLMVKAYEELMEEE